MKLANLCVLRGRTWATISRRLDELARQNEELRRELRQTQEARRWEAHALLHPCPADLPPRPVRFSTEHHSRGLAEDRDVIERIIAAYHRAAGAATAAQRDSLCGPLWGEGGYDGRQAALIGALKEKSTAGVHDVLKQFFVSDAGSGIAMGRAEAEAVRGQEAARRGYGLLWLDRLVGLAEAVGARPVPNPEEDPVGWENSLAADPAAVVGAVERHLGVEMAFPDVCGVFGGELQGRPFPAISFTHLLVALSVRAFCPRAGAHVVEIGGGFGGLALWVGRLLPCAYTIFDLPWASAVQAYFLYRALPGCRLWLFGEAEPAGAADFTLRPAWELLAPLEQTADLVVNQDSLVEVPRATAVGYLQAVAGSLRCPLLSVNHESPARAPEVLGRNSVAGLVAQAGSFVRVRRGPFALRRGYVEEVFCPA
jgi:hypothetical protein